MTIRSFGTILITLALLALPAAAHAATSSQIHRDAADGRIDGSYSMAEMRAANDSVSPELREYYGWEDAYREYIRGMGSLPTASPDDVRAPIPARRTGAGERGKPAPSDSAASAPTFTPARGLTVRPATSPAEAAEPSEPPAADDAAPDDPAESTARAAEPLALDEGSTGFPFVFLLLVIPVLVLGFGAWSAVRSRSKRSRSRSAG